MKKTLLSAAFVVVCLLVVSSTSAVAQDFVTTNTSVAWARVTNGVKIGEMYRKPAGSPTASVASMPGANLTPDASFALTGTTLSVQSGPLDLGSSDFSMVRGSAIVGPSGGSVYSTEQRAAMDIRKLIRTLN